MLRITGASKMRIITLQLEVVIPDIPAESIPDYLNNKLYLDPEFFGDIDTENIIKNDEVID